MKRHGLSAVSRIMLAGLTAILMLSSCTKTSTDVWKHDENGHFYEAKEGVAMKDSWYKMNGEYYYFDKDGHLLSNAFTPLGYHIGKEGYWDQAEVHHYYCDSIKKEDVDLADTLCRELAEILMKDESLKTDLDRVKAAASVISRKAQKLEFTNDPNKHSHSPYGMLILGAYNYKGSSHTLGRVMEYMGLSWVHSTDDENAYSWCILMMDGKIGFAEPISGVCGYGECPVQQIETKEAAGTEGTEEAEAK